MQPKIHIATTFGPSGATSALLHIESQSNVYGWLMQASDRQFSAAYFMLENFYANRAAPLYRSVQDDVYGEWTCDHPASDNLLRCPVPDSLAHELERLQSKLVDEWLFFDGDPASDGELALYDHIGLTPRIVNIKSRKLNRLTRDAGSWHHWTPGFDQNVLDYLQKYGRFERSALLRQ